MESLVLTLSVDFDTDGDNDTTVLWDQVHRQDTPFTYVAATGIITINTAGLYLFLVDMEIGGEVIWDCKFVDGGGTDTPYGFSTMNGILVPNLSCAVPMTLHAAQTIIFQVFNANDNDVLAAKSRMTVLKLGGFTGTGGNSPDPCTLDIWQLCP